MIQLRWHNDLQLNITDYECCISLTVLTWQYSKECGLVRWATWLHKIGILGVIHCSIWLTFYYSWIIHAFIRVWNSTERFYRLSRGRTGRHSGSVTPRITPIDPEYNAMPIVHMAEDISMEMARRDNHSARRRALAVALMSSRGRYCPHEDVGLTASAQLTHDVAAMETQQRWRIWRTLLKPFCRWRIPIIFLH